MPTTIFCFSLPNLRIFNSVGTIFKINFYTLGSSCLDAQIATYFIGWSILDYFYDRNETYPHILQKLE